MMVCGVMEATTSFPSGRAIVTMPSCVSTLLILPRCGVCPNPEPARSEPRSLTAQTPLRMGGSKGRGSEHGLPIDCGQAVQWGLVHFRSFRPRPAMQHVLRDSTQWLAVRLVALAISVSATLAYANDQAPTSKQP